MLDRLVESGLTKLEKDGGKREWRQCEMLEIHREVDGMSGGRG